MSLTNGSPVSAFSVYKKNFLTKGNSTLNNVIKKKNVTSLNKKQKLENHTPSEPPLKKKTGSDKVNKLIKKTKVLKSSQKIKKNKKFIKPQLVIDDDEEPPLLVPISSELRQKPNKSKSVSEPSIGNVSLSEIITDIHKTDPSPESLKLFKWLIASLSPKEFFSKYWEKEILFIERTSPNYYGNLLTTQKLDDIFREYPLYYTRNVDVVSYENGIKEVHNEEGRVVASALYDYYSNGCSIRVLNLQTYDQKVHLLISTLQEYFGTMVGTNVYLTPPGSQGFAPHFDDIEAFIVQLEGRKHWKLYKPKDENILARDSSRNFTKEEIGKPVMEVTLNAGDLLYFPRGTIHEGRTDKDAHSLHITISVYQHTAYVDLLEHVVPEALKRASMDDVSFRQGLPVNYLKYLGYVNSDAKSVKRNTVVQKVKDLMEKLIDYIDVDQAADKLGRKFMHDSMPPILSKREVKYTSKYDGDYMQKGKVYNRVEIDMDTEVRLVRYHSLRVVMEEDNVKIYYNTDNAKVYHGEEEQFLIIDKNLIPCIKKLQNIYPKFVEVDQLPGDDNIAKAQLVSDLWERGLLVTNGPLASVSDGENSSDEDISDSSF